MNEIRNSGINSYSSMGLGQIQQTQIAQQSTSSSATSMSQMLDKTLGAPASGGYLAPEQSLSLDAVTSGTVGGYLGLGNEASGSLDAPSPSNMIAAVPENNVVGFNTIQIPHIPMPEKEECISLVQIPHVPFPEREEGLALNTIQIPHIAMPDREDGVALNTVQIPKENLEDGNVAVTIPQNTMGVASMLPSETLGDFAVAVNINEASLGLVPGEKLDISKQQAIAAISVPNKSEVPSETLNNEVAVSNIPLETLAAWDKGSAFEVSESVLALNVPEKLSGLAVANNDKPFNSRAIASVPVIEGKKEDYQMAWNNISETLASYDQRSNATGFVNPDVLALDTESKPEAIGILKKANEEVGYNTFTSNEMLGLMNSSPYSAAISVNVNPTSQDSILHPEKMVAKIMYGHAN